MAAQDVEVSGTCLGLLGRLRDRVRVREPVLRIARAEFIEERLEVMASQSVTRSLGTVL